MLRGARATVVSLAQQRNAYEGDRFMLLVLRHISAGLLLRLAVLLLLNCTCGVCATRAKEDVLTCF